jgi:hypothetical protein
MRLRRSATQVNRTENEQYAILPEFLPSNGMNSVKVDFSTNK